MTLTPRRLELVDCDRWMCSRKGEKCAEDQNGMPGRTNDVVIGLHKTCDRTSRDISFGLYLQQNNRNVFSRPSFLLPLHPSIVMAASIIDEKRAERDSVDGSTKASLKINSDTDADKINEKSVVGASGAGEGDAAAPQKEKGGNAVEEGDGEDEELEEVIYPSAPKLALLTLGLALVIFVVSNFRLFMLHASSFILFS